MRAGFGWTRPSLIGGLLFLALTGGSRGQPCRWPTIDWETAPPETQGVDPSLLQAAFDHIERDLPNVFSLLVIHNGCLVAERYFRGHDQSYSQTVASVTKSFTSAVLGIAIAERRFPGIESRFSDLLPSVFQSIPDAGKRQISVEDALDMTTGLAW